MEIRRLMSEVQFRHLLDAQLKYQAAVAAVKAAKVQLDEISALVLDALQLPPANEMIIDVQTRELVVVLPESNEAA